jgi:RNA polymerase sigma factor (sigma-70 family)
MVPPATTRTTGGFDRQARLWVGHGSLGIRRAGSPLNCQCCLSGPLRKVARAVRKVEHPPRAVSPFHGENAECDIGPSGGDGPLEIQQLGWRQEPYAQVLVGFSPLRRVIHLEMSREAHAGFASRVFEQHGAAIRRYFRRMTGNAAAADDLTQEVFLHVIRAAADYRAVEREQAWLFRIARNVFLDDRRRDSAAPALVGLHAEPLTAPAQAVSAGLGEALGNLPRENREALLLGEVGGLTYREIAAATNASVPAVRNRIYRARLALRQTLAPPAPEIDRTHLRHDEDE